MINRRRFLQDSGLTLASLTSRRLLSTAQAEPFAAFDRAIQTFMRAAGVPGGALAVVKNGRLAYARGYGFADRQQKIPISPLSLFRIASISKPFTAAAVFKLIEDGKLTLETPVLDVVNLKPPGNEGNFDPRWRTVTVRHLLQHTGGWDREKSKDPLAAERSRQIAMALRIDPPAKATDIIRYMLGERFDFDPGARFAYSNFGYILLGRVVEGISGQPYEQFVKERILGALGINRMRLGATRENQRAADEVRYYTPNNEFSLSVFAGYRFQPPATFTLNQVDAAKPYGAFYLEAGDASGGWIASVIDLARFAAAFDDTRSRSLLRPETLQVMHAPPPPPVFRTPNGSIEDHYYGCGWWVGKSSNGPTTYWHNGYLDGSSTLLVRREDGLAWSLLFNQASTSAIVANGMDDVLHNAAASVINWPTVDLFTRW